MNIYLTTIENLKKEDINIELLPVKIREKFLNLCNVNEKKAIQSAFGYLLLRYICKKDGKEFNIEFTDKGKPYLKDNGFHFSISHSENVVAVIKSSENVGIDIELLKPVKEGIQKLTLNELELETYNSYKDQGQKDRYFYRCFTEKESYVKFLGSGFEALPNSIKSYEGGKFVTKYIFMKNEIYCLTICAEDIKSLKAENILSRDILSFLK